ncbi:helix-turn-helix domain-containing protein [Ruegeria arenilitoris]|uniref:helix-turn-helix domain-containing protein n=2 Tax=Ruegeria arenilitoris TaxID=1173585 RepID=UPI0014804CF7|nr:helix-turn-helix domain-containing protein [Ruegeria arenilitoris]
MPRINAMKKQTRQLLTVKDIAELDNCSEKTVRRAIAAGLLDVIRVGPGGRLIRIDPAAHAAYRQAHFR